VVTTYVERGFMSELEKCWRCGKPCNPALYVYSSKKTKTIECRPPDRKFYCLFCPWLVRCIREYGA